MRKYYRFAFCLLLCFCIAIPCITEADNKDVKTLHIGIDTEGSEYNFAVERLFLEQYPDWKIQYHLLDPEQLAIQMLSGTSEMDLLIISYQEMLYLARQNALLNLEKEVGFDGWPEMLAEMRQLHELNGSIYSLPHTAAYFQWVWNQRIASLLQCSKPEGIYTWNDFSKLLTDVRYDLDNDGKRDLGLLTGDSHPQLNGAFQRDIIELYISAYAEQEGGFNTDLFKQLVDCFITFWSDEAVMSYDRIPVFGDDLGQIITCFSTTDDIIWVLDNDSTDADYLLQPVIDVEHPKYLAFYRVWCMPDSNQVKEEAIVFLQLLLSEQAQSLYIEPQMCFSKEWPSQVIIDPNMVSTFDHFLPNESGELVWTVTPQMVKQYQTGPMSAYYEGNPRPEIIRDLQIFHENLCPFRENTAELWSVFYDNIGAYRDGSISFNELATKMDMIWDMMINE